LIEYSNTGTRIYYSNYTIYAYNSTHVGSISKNITGNIFDDIITISADTTKPIITGENATSILVSSVAIIWNTDEIANSSVNYGTTTGLGSIESSSSFLLNHSVAVSGLDASTLYYYNVTSCDFIGNCNTTGYYNFTTLSGVSCQELNSSNTIYEMTADLVDNTLTDNCVRVVAPNVTLDCRGYYIQSEDNYAGVYSNQTNTTIRNCNISMGAGVGGYGIGLENANNSYIYNNTLSNQYRGLYLNEVFDAKVENITANSNSERGIYLSSSLNNDITEVVANSNAVNGVYLLSSSNNTLTDIFVSASGYGVELSSSLRNVFVDVTSVSQTKGIYFQSSSNNNEIRDSNFSLNGWNVYVSTSINNSFVNCSYDNSGSKESVGSRSQIFRKWYYQASVVDTSATDIANASVLAYNVSGDLTMNLTTDEFGWTPIGHIIDYSNVGGTRSYYSSYIMASTNTTLWDSHNYNATSSENYLNDSFILDIDATAPVLSGVSYTATSSSAVITWTTNEGSNSSVTYWAGPAVTVGDNKYVLSHSVTISGLSASSTYSYNYTSCDFAGNCDTTSGGTFVTAAPGETTSGSSGGGSSCVANFKCGLWSSCVDGIQTRSCSDDNNCGIADYIEEQVCGIEAESVDEFEDELPFIESMKEGLGGLFGGGDCNSDFVCGEWNECRAVYTLDEIVKEKVLLKGEQSRDCVDENGCANDKVERQECDTKIPIVAKRVVRCSKDYIEIYDKKDILVSRMEMFDGNKLNVQMPFDRFGYCPYCFNVIKDFDEDEINCVYEEGGSCPVCTAEISTLKLDLMLVVLIVLIGLCLMLMGWYLILLRKVRGRG